MQSKSKKIKTIGWLFAFLVTNSYAVHDSVPPLQVNDPKYFIQDIINKQRDIVCYIDTNIMAKIVIGESDFTPAQVEEFVDIFETIIATSYNSYILEGNRKVGSLSSKYNDKIGIVDGKLGGLNVRFMLYLDQHYGWRIYNLVIEGINYGMLYRSVYKESIELHGAKKFLSELRKKLES
tara:strand:+ start:1357 stop:1893 length:537 start_codon:yes stop_codon:yes gene_type:complete